MSKWMPPKPEHYPWMGFTVSEFDVWYDKEIKPLFENAIEMVRETHKSSCTGENWYARDKVALGRGAYDHKALLIKIEPIKEDTAESLLKEIVEFNFKKQSIHVLESIHEMVKQFLEKKK